MVKVPTTFISLVDEQRDFDKSCFGFGEPLSAEADQVSPKSYGPLLSLVLDVTGRKLRARF